MIDRINPIGLWLVAHFDDACSEDEYVSRATRAFPEGDKRVFRRAYVLLKSICSPPVPEVTPSRAQASA